MSSTQRRAGACRLSRPPPPQPTGGRRAIASPNMLSAAGAAGCQAGCRAPFAGLGAPALSPRPRVSRPHPVFSSCRAPRPQNGSPAALAPRRGLVHSAAGARRASPSLEKRRARSPARPRPSPPPRALVPPQPSQPGTVGAPAAHGPCRLGAAPAPLLSQSLTQLPPARTSYPRRCDRVPPARGQPSPPEAAQARGGPSATRPLLLGVLAREASAGLSGARVPDQGYVFA